MKRINLFTVILILLLNAFITMALINKYMDKSVAIDNSYTEYSSKPSKASAANRINSITEAVKASSIPLMAANRL